MKEIYKCLQYFELESDEYRRVPAVSWAITDYVFCYSYKSAMEKWLLSHRRSSVFSYSLDNGKIITTAQIIQTQKRLQNITSKYFISIWRKEDLIVKPQNLTMLKLTQQLNLPEAKIEMCGNILSLHLKKKETIQLTPLFTLRWLS